MTGPKARRDWLMDELKGWGKAIAWMLPFMVLAWIFVFPNLPAVVMDIGFFVVSLSLFVVVGYLSRSSLWALSLWLAPWTGLTVAAIAGARGSAFWVITLVAFAYSALMMMYGWPYRWVQRATGWIWMGLVAAGLPRRERAAFRQLFRDRQFTPEEGRAARNWDDRQRMADAWRAPGERVLAIDPPDEEWAAVLQAIAAPMMEVSRAIEQGTTADYTALNSAAEDANEMLYRLLRARSLPYRILEWVPRGRE